MSVSSQAKRRGEILAEIMAYHRAQLPKQMRRVSIADLRALSAVAPPTVDFQAAIAHPGVSLIAECKKASPTKGLLVPKYDPVRLAQDYMKGGARALSILTDSRHFQGSLSHLRDVKEVLNQAPVLRKDFIFHPYQVYEARAAGADALLLIVAVLAVSELAELLALTRELGMEALIEVHTEKEMEAALAVNPGIVGINNRNLKTFEVDFENSARLRQLVPDGVVVVAESGIRSALDVKRLGHLGMDAILVGETLVKSKNPLRKTQELVAAGL